MMEGSHLGIQEHETRLQYLLDYLRQRNLTDADAIPRSDRIEGNLPQQLKTFRWDVGESLDFLTRANFLFSFELGGDGVLRFIVAEPPVLQRLGVLYRERLEQSYEQEYYRRRAAEAIIKELTPKLASLRNAELTENLNVCVLLMQYENSLATNYHEFSDHRKESVLREILTSEGFSDGESPRAPRPVAPASSSEPAGPAIPDPKMPAYERRKAPEPPPPPPGTPPARRESGLPPGITSTPIGSGRRAVETEEYQAIQKMEPKGRWERAVGIYGVQFLLRIHFRKCEFNIVSSLVKARKINERADLEYIRDTITMMLGNLNRDPCLAAHVDNMHALREQVDMRLAEG